MSVLTRTIFLWVPFAVVVTLLCGLISVTVQQNYRQSLNDPQIQMAEDGAAHLAAGGVPADIVPRGALVDIAHSLTPWIAVYDSSGKPLESTAVVNGAPPQPPLGVLVAAQNGAGKDTSVPNENRVTWQPQAGIRQAIVIVSYTSARTSGYVVAGRNMREVETRESNLNEMVFLGWLSTLLAAFVALLFSQWLQGPKAAL